MKILTRARQRSSNHPPSHFRDQYILLKAVTFLLDAQSFQHYLLEGSFPPGGRWGRCDKQNAHNGPDVSVLSPSALAWPCFCSSQKVPLLGRGATFDRQIFYGLGAVQLDWRWTIFTLSSLEIWLSKFFKVEKCQEKMEKAISHTSTIYNGGGTIHLLWCCTKKHNL